jgi:FkbM family methyltransferase
MPGRRRSPLISRLWKPWFVYRPSQLVRRAMTSAMPPARGYVPLRTSWGADVIADPASVIGRSILTTGVYDLAVTEALFRLISPGSTVVDAGANIGYMTVLAGVLAGPGGKVTSFEPHPDLFGVLQRNIAALRATGPAATFTPHQAAVGDRPGTAQLVLPPEFESNDGVARIDAEAAAGGRAITVDVLTLDDLLGDSTVDVLKIDVEGYEPQVFEGASRTLAERRIRHVVFEDLAVDESEAVRMLRAAGYRLFSLGWAMNGLKLQPIEAGSLSKGYEAPNFIATLEPDDVLARCSPRGWKSLRRHPSRA